MLYDLAFFILILKIRNTWINQHMFSSNTTYHYFSWFSVPLNGSNTTSHWWWYYLHLVHTKPNAQESEKSRRLQQSHLLRCRINQSQWALHNWIVNHNFENFCKFLTENVFIGKKNVKRQTLVFLVARDPWNNANWKAVVRMSRILFSYLGACVLGCDQM